MQKKVGRASKSFWKNIVCKFMQKIFLFYICFVCFIGKIFSVDQDFRNKIGEMLIVGFHGTEFKDNSLIAENIEKYHVGGVILFAEQNFEDGNSNIRNILNPHQLKELIEKLQVHAKKSRKPNEGELFIAIDQEGGLVNRLSKERGFMQENISAKELGRVDDVDFTYFYAEKLGKYLKELGINLNFAPTVDLAVNENNFIYKKERCFSKDPNKVYNQAKAFISGMHRYGIKTALKHFPGHGSSAGDTHRGMVDVSETWNEQELEPYQRFIDGGYQDMIMISHVINKKLDSQTEISNKDGEMGSVPATFSQKMVTEILREKMGFQGVIVSDDLCMGAIENEYLFSDTLKNAINSGIDILILANHNEDQVKHAIETIEELVDDGQIDSKKIEDAYNRIKKMKAVGLSEKDQTDGLKLDVDL